MINNGHKNQSCDLAETLVSYIYGEIGAKESAKFQAHLAGCGACAAEAAGFGVTRSSLAEWREHEFAVLSAPAIELPPAAVSSPVPGAEISWFEKIRAYFSFSPGFAMAGLAALAVCAGLTFIILNFQRPAGEMVADNRPARETVPMANSANLNNSSNPLEPSPLEPPVAKDSAPAMVHEKAPESVSPAAVTVASSPKARRSSSNAGMTKRSLSPAPQPGNSPAANDVRQAKTLPSLPDDYEDDSLRLADLFADADTE